MALPYHGRLVGSHCTKKEEELKRRSKKKMKKEDKKLVLTSLELSTRTAPRLCAI
jgi:hypothetical protein